MLNPKAKVLNRHKEAKANDEKAKTKERADYAEGGKGGGGDGSRFTTKKKPFHDSRVLKKQFHGKLDSNKII